MELIIDFCNNLISLNQNNKNGWKQNDFGIEGENRNFELVLDCFGTYSGFFQTAP
jgi:hypothetical protein